MAYTPLPVAAGGVGGAVITTTPVQLTNSNARRYQRIFNAGPGVLWLTRDPAATPAVQGPSCYSIPAGQDEEFPIPGSSYVPPAPTFAVSDSTCNVSVEVN